MDLSPSTGVLLRSDPAEFTTEELDALSRLELPDPDPEEVRRVLGIISDVKESTSIPDERGDQSEERDINEDVANEKRTVLHSGSETPGSSSPLPDKKQQNNALESDNSLFVTFPRPPKQHPKSPVNPETFFADFLRSSRPSSTIDEQSTARSLRLKDFNVRHRPSDDQPERSTSAPVSRTGMMGLNGRLSHSSLIGHSSSSHMNLALGILPRVNRQGDTDAIAETVLQTHHVEFIDYGLTDTLPAETFLNATHVFLQHNQITELDGLQLLFDLQVLVVHHNRITTLQPLGVFTRLTYLDASYNEIQHFNISWDLPDTLNVLDLRYNPCCPTTSESATLHDVEQYRQRAISHCPKITELDGKAIDDSSSENDDDEVEEEDEAQEHEAQNANKGEEKEGKSSSQRNPAPLAIHLVQSSSHAATSDKNHDEEEDDDGLVSTPTREEGGRRSPGVSRGLHRRLVPAGLRAPRDPSPGIGSQHVRGKKCGESKQTKKASAPASTGLKPSTPITSGKTKRRSVVEEARAARGVKFDLPPEPAPEPTPKGRSPSDAPIPYPKYDTSLLQSSGSTKDNQSDEWDTEGLTAPIDAMLTQYSRRIHSLMDVLRDEANVTDVASPRVSSAPVSTIEQAPWRAPGGDDDDLPEELRQARQVRNRTRSDLEYASKVLGHRSRRAIEGLWADVNKVLETRHQVISERKHRIERLTKEHSSAYLESLSLLKKEQHTTDLEKYRNPTEKFKVDTAEKVTEPEGNS